MHLALLVPDGAGVRNFLIGPFLKKAIANGPVTAIHQIPEDVLPIYRHAHTGRPVVWRPLAEPFDTRMALVLRNALAFAHMHWANTASMRYGLNLTFGGSWRTRAAMRAARFTGRLAASRAGIRRLDRAHAAVIARSPEVDYYERLFRERRPAVLLCSNQRARAAVPAVLAAKRLDIPTAAFIFSWDNLTSKGRIAAAFDHYLVWSDLMQQELRHFYPDVATDRVHVVGTPQFDPYVDATLVRSREAFFADLGADPRRPLICYSGGDRSIYPVEEQFVRILLDSIRDGRIARRPQVLLRPSPVDNGSRYQQLRVSHPELIYRPPAWLHTDPGDWTKVIPEPADSALLANLTAHADLNVNLASTMTLDFAIHDKPVVNVAFDAEQPPTLGIPLGDLYYRFEHYRPVVELGAARCVRSADELADAVNAYLLDPSLDRDARRRFVELEVAGPLGHACDRIVAVLARIAADRTSIRAGATGPARLVDPAMAAPPPPPPPVLSRMKSS